MFFVITIFIFLLLLYSSVASNILDLYNPIYWLLVHFHSIYLPIELFVYCWFLYILIIILQSLILFLLPTLVQLLGVHGPIANRTPGQAFLA